MAHYALVEDGVVQNVIVVPDDDDSVLALLPGTWIQTSYNTHGGVHSEGGTPIRKNFAGIGYVYDAVRDAFYQPKPSNLYELEESTCLWQLKAQYADLRYVDLLSDEEPASTTIDGVEGLRVLFKSAAEPGVYEFDGTTFVATNELGPIHEHSMAPDDVYVLVDGSWVLQTAGA